MQSEPITAAIERKSRHTAVGLGVLALGAVSAALFWFARGDEAPPRIVAIADPLPIANPGPASRPARASFAAVEKAAEPLTPKFAAAGAEGEIQICGGHWVKAGPDGKPAEEALQAVVAQSLDDVAGAALAAMAASPSPRARAAAHYYQAGRIAMTAPAQRDRSAEAAQRDALARLALLSDDAQVYAWAYRSCRRAAAESPGACMQINAEQWARLDPDNAEPWLAVAAEARRRKEEAALDDAMFHVAVAEQHRPGWASLAATVVEHAPQDERSLLGTERVLVQALRIESRDSTGWQPTGEYCSDKALADPNRRETCQRLATVLTDRSTTVVARSIGAGLGRRLGWDAERLAALAQLRDAEAMVSQLRSSDAAPAEPVSCTAMRANVDRVLAGAEVGEIEMLRRDVVASGRPIAMLAADARRRHEAVRQAAAERAAAAAAAASAASAAMLAQR